MIFEYSFQLPVPAERAWPVLLDVYRVAPCMPGASIESGEGNDYVGRIKVRLGPVEMVYRGDLHFTQRVDASHALAVEGAAKDTKGGGGAKAKVSLKVAEHGLSACMVSIHSDYAVSGKAAQFGRGVMEEVAEKLMNEFSARLRQLILEGAGEDGNAPSTKLAEGAVQSNVSQAPSLTISNDALDIGSAAGWAVMRRLLVGAAFVLGLTAIWWLFRT